MPDRRITARVRVELPTLAPLATATDLAVVPAALELRDVSVFYGSHRAVRDVTMEVPEAEITAFIGPSGCGKTSLLRCLNRMNDELPSARHEGRIFFRGADIDAPEVSATTVRRAIGMVFQRPNPFPKSIYENVAYAPRALGRRDSSLEVIVEEALQNAGLWDEVKDKLRKSALGLSGGQQQRLCIARALAVEPDVLLMDEPCSALDPLATLRIEELLCELKKQVTIVIVTHNLQQAARISDRTAFLSAEPADNGLTTGFLVEAGPTRQLFTNPRDSRTDDYIAGRFG